LVALLPLHWGIEIATKFELVGFSLSLSVCLSLFCRRRFCGLSRIMEKGWGLGNDARLLCGCAVSGSVRFVMKA
jgi:hypothetical protein